MAVVGVGCFIKKTYQRKENMSEYCYDSQLSSVESQLDSMNTRLFTLQEQLDEIIKFLADFKKLIGEPTWMEAPKEDKESASYFMTKMTQEEFDAIRKFVYTQPFKPNLINPQK
jgi:hypothetical protein